MPKLDKNSSILRVKEPPRNNYIVWSRSTLNVKPALSAKLVNLRRKQAQKIKIYKLTC